MPESFPDEEFQFATSAELIRHLKERSEDFERVTIRVPSELRILDLQGRPCTRVDACGTITMITGKTILLHREDFEILLNDGILQRMKIPISLVHQESR